MRAMRHTPCALLLCLLLASCAPRASLSVFGARAPPPPPRPPHTVHAAGARNFTHSTLSRSELLEYDPLSRCTDGSPAYVYSKAFDNPDMAATWLVYLPGKFFCWSAVSCATLQFWHPTSFSSIGAPKSLSLTGLFSPNAAKNPLAGANMAYIGYCSADAWLGATNQTGASSYMFNGRAILRAVFTRLVQLEGLGQPYRINNQNVVHNVLLAGGGAGGVGAMANLDMIAAELVALGVPSSQFTLRGLFDASAWAALTPLNAPSSAPAGAAPAPPPPVGTTPAAATPPLVAAVAALPWLNVSAAQLGAGCLAANPTRPALCLFAATRLPSVATPFALYAPLYDKRQLTAGFGARVPATDAALTPDERAYAAQLAAATAALLPPLKATPNAAFAPACVRGPVGLHPTFWSVRVSPDKAGPGGEASLRDLVRTWFSGDANATSPPPPAALLLADTCSGYACGTGCRRHPARYRVHDAVVVAVPPPRRTRNTFPGLRHWTFRLLVVAGVGAALYGFVQLLAVPMAQEAGLVEPERAAASAAGPSRTGASEGTPLLPRGVSAAAGPRPGAPAAPKPAARPPGQR